MANHNANFQAVPLVGSMNIGQLGDGITASTVHQVVCLANGAIDIVAIGGGAFTWTATAGQTLDVLVGSINVTGGSFVGFKTKYHPTRSQTQNP